MKHHTHTTCKNRKAELIEYNHICWSHAGV